MEKKRTKEEAVQIGRRILDILRGIDAEVLMVCNRFAVVNYHGFLPSEVMRPIIRDVCGGFPLVLMHNATRSEVCHAVNCMVVAANGERINPIEV